MIMLGKATFVLLNPLKTVLGSKFKVSVRKEKTQKCSGMQISYNCNSSEAKNTSAICRGARRQHAHIRGHSTSRSTVIGRASSRRVVAETTKTQSKVKKLQEEAASLMSQKSSG